MRSGRLRILGGLILSAGAAFLVFTANSECIMVTGSDEVAINLPRLRSDSAQLFCYKDAAGELICRVCGNHYPIAQMTEGKASCVPVSLKHEDEGGIVHIKTADLRAGRELF